MQKAHTYVTPPKEVNEADYVFQTAEFTPGPYTKEFQNTINYKSKTFKLMRQLAESEVHLQGIQVLNKKCYTQIRQIQKENEGFRVQMKALFEYFGVKSIDDIMRKGRMGQGGERVENERKLQEWSGIIQEYKKIINTQQFKFLKQEQQLKLAQARLKKEEQERREHNRQNMIEVSKLKQLQQSLLLVKDNCEQKDKQLNSLNQELYVLKKEYKDLLVDREKWKEKYEVINGKYNMEIQHFQQMQKHVEERLIEVEKEMNFYKDQRQNHLEKIELMKKQIDLNQTKLYFSFGGVKHVDTQTDNEEGSPYNQECLQISIKTLLEQNQKLKNTLLTLYKKKPEEQLPSDVDIELKILLNMHHSHSKLKEQQQLQVQQIPAQKQCNKLENIKQIQESKEEDIQQKCEYNTEKTTEQTEKQFKQ